MTIAEFTHIFRTIKFDFSSEKKVQAQIEEKLKELNIVYDRELRLDRANKPDFMIGGLCVEVKIKGGKKEIYKQLERYSDFGQVEAIILITNKAMKLPLMIGEKPANLLRMGTAWL